MKKIIFAIVFSLTVFSFCGFSFAETITLTTYYPSPYGVYKELTCTETFNASTDSTNPTNVTGYMSFENGISFNKKFSDSRGACSVEFDTTAENLDFYLPIDFDSESASFYRFRLSDNNGGSISTKTIFEIRHWTGGAEPGKSEIKISDTRNNFIRYGTRYFTGLEVPFFEIDPVDGIDPRMEGWYLFKTFEGVGVLTNCVILDCKNGTLWRYKDGLPYKLDERAWIQQ